MVPAGARIPNRTGQCRWWQEWWAVRFSGLGPERWRAWSRSRRLAEATGLARSPTPTPKSRNPCRPYKQQRRVAVEARPYSSFLLDCREPSGVRQTSDEKIAQQPLTATPTKRQPTTVLERSAGCAGRKERSTLRSNKTLMRQTPLTDQGKSSARSKPTGDQRALPETDERLRGGCE